MAAFIPSMQAMKLSAASRSLAASLTPAARASRASFFQAAGP